MNVKDASRNFLLLKERHLDAVDKDADLALTVFLVGHAFDDQLMSVGIVGQPDRNALVVLNALIAPTANLVCLAPPSAVGGAALSAAALNALVQDGYELRTHLSDLTVVGRWSRLLTAIATQPIGLIDIDVMWAASEANFWQGVAEMLQAGTLIFRLSGLLRSENALTSLRFIGSFPATAGIEPFAASDNSVWFVASSHATYIRRRLASSGFFFAAADGTIQANSGALLDFIAVNGTVPRAIARLNNLDVAGHQMECQVEYISGWCSPESDGCWTGSNEATLGIVVPDAKERIVGVGISGNVWCAPGKHNHRLEFGVGRKPLRWMEAIIPDGVIEMIHLEVPPAEAGKSLIITIRAHDAGCPSDYGGDDSRLLGFKARELILYTSSG